MGSDWCCRCLSPPPWPGDCDCSLFTGSWVVDLGLGGWANLKGGRCEEIQGQYTLDEFSECIKFYSDYPYCYNLDYPYLWSALGIQLSVAIFGTPADRWQYWLVVELLGWYPWDPPGNMLSWADYYSDVYDCAEYAPGTISPDVLTRFSNYHKYNPSGRSCSGLLPETIAIWQVPPTTTTGP
jgi:hypothetical protein